MPTCDQYTLLAAHTTSYAAMLSAVMKLQGRILTELATDIIGNFLLKYKLSCHLFTSSAYKHLRNFETVNIPKKIILLQITENYISYMYNDMLY